MNTLEEADMENLKYVIELDIRIDFDEWQRLYLAEFGVTGNNFTDDFEKAHVFNVLEEAREALKEFKLCNGAILSYPEEEEIFIDSF